MEKRERRLKTGRRLRRSSAFSFAFQSALDADEVEEACLGGARTSSEAGLLDDRISGRFADQPAASQVERAERDTQTIDSAAGAVDEELRRRSAMPGNGYPFEFNGKSLRYLGSQSLVYEFCLALSRAESIISGTFVRLPRNFERLSAIAARLYLGNGSEGIRIGSPTDEDDDDAHPHDFAGRAALLQARAPNDSEEWELAPAKDFENAAENANDYKMDFVAWKSLPDQRIGRLTLLGQCACGRHDQESDEKATELNLHSLRNIFRRVTWLDPVRLFATPYHVNAPRRFKQLHSLQNMVFDRARLASVCEQYSADRELKGIRGRLEELIRMVFDKFKPRHAGGRRASRRKGA